MALPTTNLTAHWDAADTDHLWRTTAFGTHPADGETVLAWDDEGDAGDFALFTATGSGTIVPAYRASGFNSLGCLEFDGVDDYYDTYNDAYVSPIPISTFISASAFTVGVSVILTGDGGSAGDGTTYNNPHVFGDRGGYWGLHVYTNGGVTKLKAFVWDGADKNAEITVTQGDKYAVVIKLDGGTLSIDANDGAVTDSVGSVGNVQSVVSMFCMSRSSAAVYQAMKVGEMAFYNAALTGSDLSDLKSYFKTRWVDAGGGGAFPHYYYQSMRRHHPRFARRSSGLHVPSYLGKAA